MSVKGIHGYQPLKDICFSHQQAARCAGIKTKQTKKNVNAQKYKPSDLPVIFTSLT